MAAPGGINAIAGRVGDIPATATLASVRAIHTLARIEAIKVAGPDRKLSHAGSKRTRAGGGARLNTRDDYSHGAGSATATVYAVPPGMWSWVTDGTSAHVIGFGRANKRTGNYTVRAGGANKRLRMPGTKRGWVTGPVFHPGTAGKGAWTNVRVRGLRVAREIFASELRKALG